MKGRIRMKKSNLVTAITYIAIGLLLLAGAAGIRGRLSRVLFGFFGGFMGAGIAGVWRYFYWSAPGNRQRYEEKLDQERIELQDEMKSRLRDQSGRYAYLLGLTVLSASIVVFSVLGALNILDSRVIILFLGGYLLFQVVAGMVIFKHLLGGYLGTD